MMQLVNVNRMDAQQHRMPPQSGNTDTSSKKATAQLREKRLASRNKMMLNNITVTHTIAYWDQSTKGRIKTIPVSYLSVLFS
jgi:hypothetical protein